MVSFLRNTKNITFFLKLSQCFICSVLTVHITFSNALVIYVQTGHYTDYKSISSPRLLFIYIPEHSSVQFSCSVMSDSLRPNWLQHSRLLSLSITNTQTLLKLVSIESVISSNHHPLLSPSPPPFNLCQHQGISQWDSSSHQVAKLLEFQLQNQSYQWIFRTDFL